MSHYLLTNTVMASAFAVIAFLGSRLIRNASIVHILWAVVLLRFVAPPLVNLPLDFPSLESPNPIANSLSRSLDGVGSMAEENLGPPPPNTAQELRSWTAPILVIMWALGAVVVVALCITRAVRFQRLIRSGEVADERLRKQLHRVADEMSVRSVPTIRLVQARISPMLWAWFRRPVLLLPKQLWSTLSEDEKTAVLRHELAHLARRDHWVRILEAAATITHWWCPVLWWARGELHRYEERCCDAWASSAGPQARAALARACLSTVDFVGRNGVQGLQFGATRMAGFRSLRERLEFILEGEKMHATARRVNAATMVVSLFVLGISPV